MNVRVRTYENVKDIGYFLFKRSNEKMRRRVEETKEQVKEIV